MLQKKTVKYFSAVFMLMGCFLFASFPAWAASVDSGQQMRIHQQSKSQQDIQKVPRLPTKSSVELSGSVRKPQSGSVYVESFLLEGNITAFKRSELQSALRSFTHKTLGISGLWKAGDAVTALYRQHGYILARAILQPQDVSKGIITIHILEGILDDQDGVKVADLKHSLRLDKSYAESLFISTVKPGEAISSQRLERAVGLLSTLPGVSTKVSLMPGGREGTTRAVLDLEEKDLLNPWTSFDNYGSRLTGTWRMSSGVDLNNMNGRGNQLSLYLSHALGDRRLGDGENDFLSVSYTHPIGYDGLKLGVDIRLMHYIVGSEFSQLNLKGNASALILSAEYPALLSRFAKLDIRGSFEWKGLNDTALNVVVGNRRLNVATLGVNGEVYDTLLGGGSTTVYIGVRAGELDLSPLSAALIADQSSTGLKADGSFQKINFSIKRQQRITQKAAAKLELMGQFAKTNLDSSEKLHLGGAFGIRAFPMGEASGDNGMTMSTEFGYQIGQNKTFGKVRLITFYDWGWVEQFKRQFSIMATPNRYQLQGAGIGIEAGNYNSALFQLTYARAIGKNRGADPITGKAQDGSNMPYRIWLSARGTF